jgi:hypothetical protein
MNYWKESIEAALDEAGLTATPDQIETITKCVEISHDQYGMAFGHDCIPNPLKLENEQLKRELKVEQSKIACKECHGRGNITENFGTRSSTSRCDRCNGEGKHLP